MMGRSGTWTLVIVAVLAVCNSDLRSQQPAGDDYVGMLEEAIKAAAARVAPSIVQIETSGGTDVIGSGREQIREGIGPSTGLVVSADGHIISSAANFANHPSTILVAIPGQRSRQVAKVIATDHTRMLTLLKVDAAKLPVPVAVPKKDIRVGQWVVALGRTWGSVEGPPSVSVGIVSALERIWGKAIQTDAKVSPVNYGGPLVDLRGRVLGVLIPASPRGQDETAGIEWYDSGIGFAIPAEDINAVLPRLKEGKDLHKGVLGITLQSLDLYAVAPIIAGTVPESPAMKGGIKTGDVISEVNGVRITRQAQLMHVLGKKYEGDSISLKVRRGKDEISFPDVKLAVEARSSVHPFLGILAMRDDPEAGEEVRYVFPKSPAEAAGLKAGDRIRKIGVGETPPRLFGGRDALTTILSRLTPTMELKLEVARKDGNKTETLKVALGMPTDYVPDALPEPASKKKALQKPSPVPEEPVEREAGARRRESPKSKVIPEKKAAAKPEEKNVKKAEVGLLKRKTPTRENDYWLYVPENYDPNVGHALVVWLHPAGNRKDKDHETEQLIDAWKDSCSANHIIMLCPKAESENGWLASEADFIVQTIGECLAEYSIDRQRIVAHGMGIGGQMAFYLGFNARDLIRGVATTGAVLANQPKENSPVQRLNFFLVAGKGGPLNQAIADSKSRLIEFKYPVVYREIPDLDHRYLNTATLDELVRWIDSLDRQ
jgi:S1-C subfamily serine protease/predicted esterase